MKRGGGLIDKQLNDIEVSSQEEKEIQERKTLYIESYTRDYFAYVCDPLYKDFTTFFKKFPNELYHFADFKQIWINSGFPLVLQFEGISHDIAKVTLQMAFQVVIDICMTNTKSIPTQITALYTLYTLYNTQHNIPLLSINVTLLHFSTMVSIANECQTNGLVDVKLILKKLFDSSAFIYSMKPNVVESKRIREFSKLDKTAHATIHYNTELHPDAVYCHTTILNLQRSFGLNRAISPEFLEKYETLQKKLYGENDTSEIN
ncbi:hypothetical protein EIN_178400 [Entamoeba invadens IP1]|uniref:hypothetical protein n=1 Tax=Entamoeba invadens IP1 TaxID=370355 RepID=UPI0002C3E179|nr:hypothetical protein EIN_178400 [Entamoeba invadens IP1]ELP93903.1 hypothetical protein EIN_178400 [Entamoeba invadens IP1]|eukprot:XP_004260674.1 hypothetical protein EIN_178400 [Entamoeba invadens IP1]